MDAVLVADTIFETLLCANSSLAPLATDLSAEEIQQFENLLKGIHDMMVEKMKHNNYRCTNFLSWLSKMKEVMNDLKYLMEDLQLRKENRTPTICLVKAYRGRKVTKQLKKAEAELKRLVTEAENSSFFEESSKKERKFPNIYHEFENFEGVGRENDKKEIIGDHLRDGEGAVPIAVVSLVGIAGIGKTKLARLVCQDEQVKAHFGSPIWIHANETFNMESIVQSINGKRFLLVLDDFINEIGDESFIMLQHKLKETAQSYVAILITTRSNDVANKIVAAAGGDGGGTVKLHALHGLNQEDSWSLFLQIRGQGSSNIEEDIEREMVREYCGGVPLAIITLARLLNSHESSVSKSQVAVLKEEFLHELKFTYYDQLPMHHRLCFAYCSLFPQDHVIKAEWLIHLWIVEGFLSRIVSSKDEPEEVGLMCFKDFVPFIFQQAEEQEFYRMNPLMHELARIVAWDENIRVDNKGEKVHERMLRASFNYSLTKRVGMPESLFEKAKKLRTILLTKTQNQRGDRFVEMTTSTCNKIFESFKCLHVLDLHNLGIQMVPRSIGEVKHLQYLDLSKNFIEKLPNAITKLFHLQTLKLSHCIFLKKLPKNLKDLNCLKHLDLDGCYNLTDMPPGISKLSSLQTLSLFMASKNYNMGGLGELTALSNLRGNLKILQLEQLKLSSSLDAKDKYLKNKEHLRCLSLQWDHKKEGEDISDKDNRSLECLEPNPNLRVLLVMGYHGNMFSNWLSSIQCLVEFSLSDCPKCQFLPPLHHLPHLRILQLRKLSSLEYIEKNNGSSSSTSISRFFPSLKELTIFGCPKLKDCLPLYPYLDEELILVKCSIKSMMDTMHGKTSEDSPPFSKVKSMVIHHIKQSPPETWLENFTSLENLHIRDCPHLESLSESFKCLSSLQVLTIEKCPMLDLDKSKTEWEGLKNLRSLTIKEIPNLKSLPIGMENVTSLQEIEIDGCSALTFLPENIGNLTLLGKLTISYCKSLESLPKEIKRLKYLETLIITCCPLLNERCIEGLGKDWPQISHIRNIEVKRTSPRAWPIQL